MGKLVRELPMWCWKRAHVAANKTQPDRPKKDKKRKKKKINSRERKNLKRRLKVRIQLASSNEQNLERIQLTFVYNHHG